MRCLAGSRSLRLQMQGECKAGEPLKVVVYSAAGFAADTEDRKSVTAGFVTAHGMAVGWVCMK
ncbi:hypothetical protein PI125_g21214 [Phytophthora idaei]|nr:hypothetical protein PI125_g21214 [Phytophthora idaei]